MENIKGTKKSINKKKLITVIAVVIFVAAVALAGYFGYQSYRLNKLVQNPSQIGTQETQSLVSKRSTILRKRSERWQGINLYKG